MTTVTTILTCHDKWPLLERAVESVRAQTFRDWELIIVDDDSRDSKVLRYLDKIASRKIKILRGRAVPEEYRAQHKMNMVRINAARALARGTYIAYLGDDNEWLPRHLERCVAAIEKEPRRVAVAYEQVQWVTFNGRRIAQGDIRYEYPVPREPGHDALIKAIAPDTYICHDAVVHRKMPACYSYPTEQVEGRAPQDWLFWLELHKRHGFKRLDTIGVRAIYPGTWREGTTMRELLSNLELSNPAIPERRAGMVNRAKLRKARKQIENEEPMAESSLPYYKFAVNTSGRTQQITNPGGSAPLRIEPDARIPAEQVMTEKGLYPGFSYDTQSEAPPVEDVLSTLPEDPGEIEYEKDTASPVSNSVDPGDSESSEVKSPFDDDLLWEDEDDGEAFDDLPAEPKEEDWHGVTEEVFGLRKCRECGTVISKRSKTGLCRDCYNASRRRVSNGR